MCWTITPVSCHFWPPRPSLTTEMWDWRPLCFCVRNPLQWCDVLPVIPPTMNLTVAAKTKKSSSSIYLSDLEQSTQFFNAKDYMSTSSGNIVSRGSILCGTQNIHLHGKTIISKDTIIRGDLAYIRIGRYCILEQGAVVRPPSKRFTKGFHFIPLNIGNYVHVGHNAVIEAAQIGSYVMVGKNCVISPLCILRDCCEIMDGSVLAPGTVVPPFSRYGGVPAKLICELPQCSSNMIKEYVVDKYKNFQPFSQCWNINSGDEW